MNEEVQLCLDSATENMIKVIDHLETELKKIRAGKASPSMLDSVSVDYYGNSTPLSQVSNVNTPDGKTISVQPWEKDMIEPIEKAIMDANLGLTPINNGELIRINIPALTEERRRDLAKNVRAEGETARISARNARKEANDFIKSLKSDGLSDDLAKDAEDQVQTITNDYTGKIDSIVKQKEDDLMTM